MLPFDPYQVLQDSQSRTVRYVRLSVTDRCNYRCVYCMPAEGVTYLKRNKLLSYEELVRLVRIFVSLGIDKVRITGGEPLVRRDLVGGLIARLAAVDGVRDIAMTTNAHLLVEHAQALADAGLNRINVSLDTLDAERFSTITRGGDLAKVLAGLEAAADVGLGPVKLNTVVVGGFNDDEYARLVRFAAEHDYVLRFIEYMPIGVDDAWRPGTWVPMRRVREQLSADYEMVGASELGSGAADASDAPDGLGRGDIPGGGPAVYTELAPKDGSHGPVKVGFIAALSENFCSRCNRVRVSSEGALRECLSREGRLSLRDRMRGGATDDELREEIRHALYGKVEGHQFGTEHGHVGTRRSMSSIGG